MVQTSKGSTSWTSSGINIGWDKYWVGETLVGTNSKGENNESYEHKMGQKSNQTNIEWDKHQVGQISSESNIINY